MRKRTSHKTCFGHIPGEAALSSQLDCSHLSPMEAVCGRCFCLGVTGRLPTFTQMAIQLEDCKSNGQFQISERIYGDIFSSLTLTKESEPVAKVYCFVWPGETRSDTPGLRCLESPEAYVPVTHPPKWPLETCSEIWFNWARGKLTQRTFGYLNKCNTPFDSTWCSKFFLHEISPGS